MKITKATIRRFIPLAVILIAMMVVYATGLYKYLSFELLKEKHGQLQQVVHSYPILTPILYMLLYAVAIALSIPGGALLSLVGGYLFPIPLSTLYVVIGATIGASAIFLAAKTALGDVIKKKAGPLLKKVEKGFQKDAWSYLLFLRFIPLFPFWFVNVAPAFFAVPFLTYLWTTIVGIIPGAYVYTQTGEGLRTIFETGESFSLGAVLNIKLRIALIALALFSLVPIFVKKIIEKRKSHNNLEK